MDASKSIFLEDIDSSVKEPNAENLKIAKVLLIRHATTHFNVVHQQIGKEFGLKGEEFRKLRADP